MIAALPPTPSFPLNLTMQARVVSLAERREDDIIGGVALHLELDEGKVVLDIDSKAETAYIDAAWPHSRQAMLLTISRARFYGWNMIPEDETPPEILPNGHTRIWLMRL